MLSGRYELLDPLGRGGMGVVYRARDQQLDRLVAVKVMPAQMLRDEGFRARFRREARAAAGLSHPSIAVIHDTGEDAEGEEPVPYLVMELVEGRTLADLLREASPTLGEAGQIVVAVLEALEHSHGREVVHRDIKPANIMVHRAGGRVRVKVLDFGIAKLMSETATRLTATGLVIGTPSYMSPEQADGEAADAYSDLYSTGCVLYEMLTGRPPFTGDSHSVVLFQHVNKTPRPPSQLNPVLDAFWDQVLATALAKDPRQRYRDAAAMRQAIETGTTAPGQAPPQTPAPSSARSDAPTRTHVAAPPHRTLTRRRLLTRLGAGLGVAGLAAALPAAHYISTRDESTTPTGEILNGHTGGVRSVAFSPDGKLLASCSNDETVRLWDAATRRLVGRPLTGHTDSVGEVAFSPDGKLLAAGGSDATVRFWDVATHVPVGGPLTGHNDSVYSMAFSPDGKLLAVSDDDTVWLWDVAARTTVGRLRIATDPHSLVVGVAFSPDGRTLAVTDDDAAQLWDVGTRRPAGRPFAGHTDSVYSLAFSLDGKLLATGSSDGTIRLWEVATHTPIGHPLTGHHQNIDSVAFSPDGKILASSSDDETVRLWDVASRRPIGRSLADHSDGVNSVAFSPDGKLLATGSHDDTVRLWRLEEGLASNH
ncbi:protein kinase [Actinomadura sp. KC345]|uniref:protein kinase domain-containing protein n=1 Tax=Actinomadura sp. KC345 TaxID=2530371 RepID=UPI001FB61486|nr:protein kinase [Actinomadura sp. KC345]